MNKTALLSVLASTLIMASGDIDPVKSTNSIDRVESSIPTGFALLGGVLKSEGYNTDSNALYGAEFSFECLFSSDIKSQLQFTYYDDEDSIKRFQLSANPHYIVNRGDTVEFGFGPHLGAAKVEMGSEDDTVFTYGLGASLRSSISENFFVGAEARYEWTTDAEFSGVEDNLNNAKVFAKIGYSF